MREIDNEVKTARRTIINKRLKEMQAGEYIHEDFLYVIEIELQRNQRKQKYEI